MPPRREPYDLAPVGLPPDPRAGDIKFPLEIDSSAHYMILVPTPPTSALGDFGGGEDGLMFVLPMPKGMQYTDTHTYNDVSMSSIAGSVLGAIESVASTSTGKLAKIVTGGLALIGSASGAIGYGAQIFQRPVLTAVEVMFSNTPQRTFAFEFHLTPRNEAEAFTIWFLIQRLRFYAAPKAVEGYGGVWAWYSPWKWKPTFYYNGEENLYIPKMHQCVLERIESDYDYFSDGMWATYDGGAPIGTKLTLWFKELEVSHKDKVDAGY